MNTLNPLPTSTKTVKVVPLTDEVYDGIINYKLGKLEVKGADANLSPLQRSIRRSSKHYELVVPTDLM